MPAVADFVPKFGRSLTGRRMSSHPAVVEEGKRSLAALQDIGLPD